MFKRGISALIVLCLLAATVLCLPAAASGETEVTLKKIKYNAGKTTISWKTEGEEPESYTVTYKLVDNGTAPQITFRMDGITKHSLETWDFLPGKKYEVTVWDPFYSMLAKRTYTVPEAEEFVDGKLKATSVKISVEPVKMKYGGNEKKDPKKIKALKASEIIDGIKNQTMEYGVKYTMKMPRLAKARSFFVTIAFESPDGYIIVDRAGDLTFDRVNGGYQTLWLSIAGNRFFNYMYRQREEIPTGTYKIHLFWDGMKVQTQSFKVN